MWLVEGGKSFNVCVGGGRDGGVVGVVVMVVMAGR